MTSLTDLRVVAEEAALVTVPAKWYLEISEANEPNAPDCWRVASEADRSYEATICECWSGEHDNEKLARYIAAVPPFVTLPLLDRIEKAEADLATYRDYFTKRHILSNAVTTEGQLHFEKALLKVHAENDALIVADLARAHALLREALPKMRDWFDRDLSERIRAELLSQRPLDNLAAGETGT